jgi:hypothetical protein
VVRWPVPESAQETVSGLLSAAHQPTDYYRLATQLEGIPADRAPNCCEYKVNDRNNFFVTANLNSASRDYRTIPARLRYISDTAYWWTSVEARASDEDIVAAASRFEEMVVPINRKLFGKEWSPGIDGDTHIHILLIQEANAESTFGYFSNIHEYPQAIFEDRAKGYIYQRGDRA